MSELSNDIGVKGRSCSLRIPERYNTFLEKVVTDNVNSKSNYFLAGSIFLSSLSNCLNNEESFMKTYADTKKQKTFDHNMKMIAKSSYLLDSNLLAKAGVTQESLNHVFLVFNQIAEYLKAKKAELDKEKEKGE